MEHRRGCVAGHRPNHTPDSRSQRSAEFAGVLAPARLNRERGAQTKYLETLRRIRDEESPPDRVLRIIDDALIDPASPVRQTKRTVDYDSTESGKQVLLALHADIRMATDRVHTRNVVEFTGRREFVGESPSRSNNRQEVTLTNPSRRVARLA